MKQKIVLFTNILLVFLLGISSVNAQAKKKKQIKPKKTGITKLSVENKFERLIPEIKDFAFVINIDKNSNVTLKIQTNEDSDVLTNASNTKTLTDFFSGVSNPKTSFAPILIVKADSSLNYSDIINVIKASRTSPAQKTKVEISRDFYAFVPAMPGKNLQVKPNPLVLIVELDKNLNLVLNGEAQKDITQLQNSLKQIFKAREDNGVFREGTNQIETTVFIKAAPTAKFAEVIKIAEALRVAGSTIVGLLVDDFEPVIQIEINE